MSENKDNKKIKPEELEEVNGGLWPFKTPNDLRRANDQDDNEEDTDPTEVNPITKDCNIR